MLINKMRFWLNSVMGSSSYGHHHQAAPSKDRIREVSHKTLKMLFQLINKQRPAVDTVVQSNTYKWHQVKPEHVLQSDVSESQLDCLIPLHDCIKLCP